jgi:hypothetical protein
MIVSYDLGEITDTIIQHLDRSIADVDVVSFPGDPSELARPQSRRTIFVGLSDISAPEPKQGVVTSRIQTLDTISFELVLNWVDRRSLRAAVGAIQTIRNILTGFQPIDNWDRYLYMRRAGFMDFNRGTWVYSIRFEMQIPYSKQLE